MTGFPIIPESAPFSLEQRAWLNGFLAGSLGPVQNTAATPATPAAPQTSLAIAFGSQTGNAEGCARTLAKKAAAAGIAATVHDLESITPGDLATFPHFIIVTSTYGDGEMPDNALAFWQALAADDAPTLTLEFGVFALGDHNYDATFCDAGKLFDARLAELGGTRIVDRVDADVDFDDDFDAWCANLLDALPAAAAGAASPNVAEASQKPAGKTPLPSATKVATAVFSKKNPYPANLISNLSLNGAGSAKDTRHVAINLAGSGLRYEAGDALGVIPENAPQLVRAVLDSCGFAGDEPVVVRDAPAVPIEQALRRGLEISSVPKALVDEVATRHGKDSFMTLLNGSAPPKLADYLYGRDVLDVLTEHATAFAPQELVDVLKPLQPRLYSISSSPKTVDNEVHLTVGVVRYERAGRVRRGACSGWLAGAFSDAQPLPIYVHQNKAFRPPADPATPVIMVGPGTGIAPFRAFLHDRAASAPNTKSWLFFGDQRQQTDFLYRDELTAMRDDGRLARLDLAFSRDQEEKVYVQHRMREHGAELYRWLQEGAYFYVCGDASRMAKDVEAALIEVYQTHGNLDPEAAAAAVAELRSQKRYQRDVY